MWDFRFQNGIAALRCKAVPFGAKPLPFGAESLPFGAELRPSVQAHDLRSVRRCGRTCALPRWLPYCAAGWMSHEQGGNEKDFTEIKCSHTVIARLKQRVGVHGVWTTFKELEVLDGRLNCSSLKSGDPVISAQLLASQVYRLEYFVCCRDNVVRRYAVLLHEDGTPRTVGLMGKGYNCLLSAAQGAEVVIPPCFSTLQAPLPAVEIYVQKLTMRGARADGCRSADVSPQPKSKRARRNECAAAAQGETGQPDWLGMPPLTAAVLSSSGTASGATGAKLPFGAAPPASATPRASAIATPPDISRHASLQQSVPMACQVSFQQMVTTLASAPTDALADAIESLHAALLQRGMILTPMVPAAKRGSSAMIRASFNNACSECEEPGLWSPIMGADGALVCCSGCMRTCHQDFDCCGLSRMDGTARSAG